MRIVNGLRLWIGLAVIGVGGCGLLPPTAKEKPIKFSAADGTMSLRTVDPGGDFALFYPGEEKGEIPVRVNSGDTVGFVREEDGRLKAIAGPFKMNVKPEAESACWKRLSTIE